MTPGFIQEPLPLKLLARVSPSRYALFRACPLREIWAVDPAATLLPRNPMTILGQIAHQVLQEASQKRAAAILMLRRSGTSLCKMQTRNCSNLG